MGATQSTARTKPHELEVLVTSDEPPSQPSAPSPRSVNEFEPPQSDISAVVLSPTISSHSLDGASLSILILMSDTGGGHRASSQALEAAFDTLYADKATVTTVDFWTSIAGFPFRGFPSQYTYLAKRPILWKAVYLFAAFPPTRWLTETTFSCFCHHKVRRYFEQHNPDLIISVHPLVNTLSLSVLDYMRDLSGRPPPPYATVVTDLGGAHPTWFDARSDLVYVPSEPLHQTAMEAGVRREKIRLLGLPIRSSFWEETRSRKQLREELGMAQNIPAVLLVGGGDGVGGLQAIASAIATRIAENSDSCPGQLVVICGKNESLLRRMQARSWPVPVILKGFVKNMSEWMSASDVLCSKAGPGTIAEAWIRGLPIILTGFLPGQEEGNTKLVTDSGSGELHTEPEEIARCAFKWVNDPELRAAIASRARSLGRPKSCLDIAQDVWKLGQERRRDREAHHRTMMLSPSVHIPNGYVAMLRFYSGSAIRFIQRGFNSLMGYRYPELNQPRE